MKSGLQISNDCGAPKLQPAMSALWIGLVCVLWCATPVALSLEGTIHDLKHTAWGPKEGAPSGVTSLAQTGDGYLWLGNAAGLFRFDGLRFERVDLPRDSRLSSLAVYSLFAPASGGLWIGFTFGGAAFLKDGKMTAYAEADGLPPGSIKAFAMQKDGTVWAGGSSGLARLEGARWRKVGSDENFSDTQNILLMTDSAGTLWAASRNKLLFLRRGDRRFQESPVHLLDSFAFALAESATGTVWLSSSGRFQRLAQNEGGGKAVSAGHWLLFDRDGSLWMGKTGEGVRRVTNPDPTGKTSIPAASDWFVKNDGLSDDQGVASGILEDSEGNVWLSTDSGLDRFSERKVARGLRGQDRPAFAEIQFAARPASFAAGDDGALWVGGGSFPLFEEKAGRPDMHKEVGYITCSTRSADGVIWFGGSQAIWRHASDRFDRTDLPPGTDGFEVQAMAQERAGALWVSIVRKGLFRLANGAWSAYGGLPTLPKAAAIVLSTDTRGRVWFGYTEGRVAMLEDGTVTLFTDSKRAPVGNVTAIYGQRKRVWAGGDLGLALFDGNRFVALQSETAGAFDNVTGIVETANGDVWLNSHVGIVHVVAAEVARVAADPTTRTRSEIFDALDDVQGTSARLRPLPSAIEGSDDTLWFLRDIDIYSIEPAGLRRNPVAPPVAIQSLTADDKVYEPAARVTLPQGTSALRVDYAGLSLTMAEKVRYRYRLDGVDKDWQEAGGRRQAFYTNLAPGPHHFQVIAANNDGVWNDSGATLDFVIPPTFLQTGWFTALCIAGAIAVAGLLVGVRFRQLSARMRLRYEERMAERERIARELHDTLLQGTQALMLKVQAASNRVHDDGPARKMLEEALVSADDVMAEGRDRIQDLRIAAEARGDLPKSLAAVGEELAQGQAIAFRVVVEGAARELKLAVRDEAYRIGREALLNAFRHAQARSIEVQIIFADDLRMRVRDDGLGIDPAALEAGSLPGHWGLQGMRERAKKLGATIEIWSRSEAGTEIELRIPAAAAYAERSLLARWLPFWWPASAKS